MGGRTDEPGNEVASHFNTQGSCAKIGTVGDRYIKKQSVTLYEIKL